MTGKIEYRPSGVCSRMFEISVSEGKIENINVVGGCDGNLKGLSQLLRGMNIDDAISRMSGITCGQKATSCPDQISKALLELKQAQ